MTYGIGFGSNMGDRVEHIRAGMAFLNTIFKSGWRVSSLYETSPVGCPPGSPDFINAVAEGEFEGNPLALHRLLKAFEQTRGDRRPPAGRNEPRALDLDLLYAEGPFASAELTLPHPRLHLRRFVLQPLAEIHPALVIPGLGKTVQELLAALKTDEVVRAL